MEYSFHSFEDLKELVLQNENVLTVRMAELRDVQGDRRLGTHVVAAIADSLAAQGLKACPGQLPLQQHNCVRLYVAGSPIGKLFEAMLGVKDDGHMDSNHKNDQLIRDTVRGSAQEILGQIRQMVCS